MEVVGIIIVREKKFSIFYCCVLYFNIGVVVGYWLKDVFFGVVFCIDNKFLVVSEEWFYGRGICF